MSVPLARKICEILVFLFSEDAAAFVAYSH